jgi:hypothetical protein
MGMMGSNSELVYPVIAPFYPKFTTQAFNIKKNRARAPLGQRPDTRPGRTFSRTPAQVSAQARRLRASAQKQRRLDNTLKL